LLRKISGIHELHSIYDVKVVGDHHLQLTFKDGIVKIVDLTGFWESELFKPIRDPEFFRQVKPNEGCHVIEWPNGADFDPETLYHGTLRKCLQSQINGSKRNY